MMVDQTIMTLEILLSWRMMNEHDTSSPGTLNFTVNVAFFGTNVTPVADLLDNWTSKSRELEDQIYIDLY